MAVKCKACKIVEMLYVGSSASLLPNISYDWYKCPECEDLTNVQVDYPLPALQETVPFDGSSDLPEGMNW